MDDREWCLAYFNGLSAGFAIGALFVMACFALMGG
jgi:hypothetical protein